jgi:hypothetical protein
MNKQNIKNCFNKPILFALFSNAIFLLLSLLLFHPHFETNDDAIRAMIAEGAYGESSPFLVNIHYGIGVFLQLLYRITPGIRWYSIVLFVFTFSSFTAIVFVIVKKTGSVARKWLAILFLLSFFYEGYVLLQYTKIAAFLAVAGFMLLFDGMRDRKYVQSGIGSLFVVIGSMLRFPAFLVVVAFMLLAGLWELWCLRERKISYKHIVRYVLCFILLLFVVLGIREIDSAVYNANEDWGNYLQLYHKRQQVLDYNRLDWSAYEDRYVDENISENDVLSYVTWQYAAPDVFTPTLMDKLLEIADGKKLDAAFAKGFISMLYEIIYSQSNFVIGVIAFCIFYILFTKKENKFIFLATSIMLVAIHVYYYYIGRWTDRTVTLIWFAAFVILLYYFREKEEDIRPLIFIVSLCLVNLLGLFLGDMTAYQKQKREVASQIEQFYDVVEADKESLYIFDTFTDRSSYEYSIFTPCQEGCYENVSSFGSWMVNSPIFEKVLDAYGVTNPYRASFENPNIYIVDNYHINNKLLFIKEHYGIAASVQKMDEIYGFCVYKIRAE